MYNVSHIFKLASATGDCVKETLIFPCYTVKGTAPWPVSVMVLKMAADTTMRKDFVLSPYYESDDLPHHKSIELCLGYPFPKDLRMLRHSEQHFSQGL